MKSLKQYYSILKKDITRNGAVARNHFLDSITGSDVQSSNLLSSLAEFIGIRKKTIWSNAKLRLRLETEHTLIPIATRMQRKSPEGDSYMSTEWKVRGMGFYELESTSEVMKGHHQVFKVQLLFICLFLM